MKCPAILSFMHSSRYILWQDNDGWRGYIQGYPEREAYGATFEDLQSQLWHMHQNLASQVDEGESGHHHQERESRSEHGHHSQTPTLSRPISRPLTRSQIKRRGRVEQLMFAIISNR